MNNFPFLIQLFNDYNLPVTWGIVGHLFLHSCNKDSHAWMRRIPYFKNKNWIYNRGDWFDADPYTCWEEANGWYAPDLIQMILNSRVGHEIGCHTFSHIDFSYKNCPQTVAEDELKACTDVAREWGIEMKSLIFAGGTYGNYEVLKKYGFVAYRKTLECELAYPLIDENGLVVIPASTGLENNQLGWSAEYLIKRYKKYIDKAIKTGTICHFWFHPSVDEWYLHNVFPGILSYAAELRDRNLIAIQTMKNVAEFVAPQLKVI